MSQYAYGVTEASLMQKRQLKPVHEISVELYARSVWMVLDMTTHDNFGLAHLSLPDESVCGEPCPIAPQAKHTEILPYLTSESNANPKALKANVPDAEYTFKYNDIDFYRHVNTVRYITILLNRYSLEEFDRNFVNRLELSFLHEPSMLA